MKVIKQILIFTFLIILFGANAKSQNNAVDKIKIKEDLNEIITDLSQNYIYLNDKKVDIQCVENSYGKKINSINSKGETLLFFEYLLDEFYDSHLHLKANNQYSFRLYSPLYSITRNGKTTIKNVWQTQIENPDSKIIGAEIQKFNGIDFQKTVNNFPTSCNDKNSGEVRTWLGNKILAGRYDEPRILTLKLSGGKVIDFDLDKVKLKNNDGLLTSRKIDNIGIIRINDSLGNSELINAFDEALDGLFDTKGLILDLRNTADGGNTYVARGIMGRFIEKDEPFQKHRTTEMDGNNPKIIRSWIEYVSPRLKQYKKPLVILVDRWTGSMGEGIAIGFDAMKRAEIVGSEMARLAGAVNGFSFKNLNFGYQISTEKLFHINGMPREKYVPANYVTQTRTDTDEILEKGMEIINKYENSQRKTKYSF